MEDLIINSLKEHYAVAERFVNDPATARNIEKAARLIASSIKAGGKVLACGNGGSLCDATHFAEELTGRFRDSRAPLPAMAINDPAHITCTTNDYSFEKIFSRVVEALGRPGDVLCGFSTSGTSKNVVEAARAAREKGMKVVGFTRAGENPLAALSDAVIAVDHGGYSDRIQEMHITAVHIIIEGVERLVKDCL